ncbi:hypothetical protein [uncultured Methanoregula sp.]|uniref:hypothetical protein n=1 Tax=uncultured Methanoregula sp. TaxID=1005933 RepID=UPI002AAB264E|nr:hypothetical protein [uncultured Methanoregula sp.]
MSPRHPSPKEKTTKTVSPKQGPGMDRDRHLEDAKHHPLDHPLPHPPHKTIKKPVLPKDHATHTHPHEEARGPHTGKPGPITPAKKTSRPVSKK